MTDNDELYRQYSRKGRSASICLANAETGYSVGAEKLHRESVPIPVTKHGSGIVNKTYDSPAGTPSGHPRFKQRQAARRSKSDRIQGQNRPQIRRRVVDGPSALDLAAGSELSGTEGSLQYQGEEQSYNPFLLKMPSTTRLAYDSSTGGGLIDTPDTTPPTTRRAKFSSINVTQSSEMFQVFGNTQGQQPNPISAAKPSLARHASTRNSEKSPASRAKQSQLKRASSTRVPANQVSGSQKAAPKYLGLPDADDSSRNQDLQGDSLPVRSFSFTSKGLVNRGDSFRKRDADTRDIQTDAGRKPEKHGTGSRGKSYRVAIVGVPGVGKTSLLSQFMTSESINAYDRPRSDDEGTASSVSVMLNGEESELSFTALSSIKTNMDRREIPDGLIMVYSVVDKASFTRLEDELARLRNWDALKNRAIIIVGNKIDLARRRTILSEDGKCLACAYGAKFCETSVAINHNVDELLVGILKQIRIKESLVDTEDIQDFPASSSWFRSKSLTRASMKAKQLLTWVFGKDDDQFKDCENLQIP